MNYIIEFQEKYKIPLTGTLDRKTLLKMKSVWGISNNQLAHVLANVDNETGNFTLAYENLNYSAKRLIEIFKYRLDRNKDGWLDASEKAKIKEIAGNPQKIANFVYADRYGNGNEASGDGWRYRGRGGIQVTFKSNYQAFSNFTKDKSIIANPDLVASKYFWESAIWFFTYAKLWSKMLYSDEASVKAVRKAVNGGAIGLDHVQTKFKYYIKLLNEIN